MSVLTPRRLAAAAVVGAALVVATAAPAFAHVSVNPSTASQGGYAALTFRVPTESDSVSTTKVEVAFPADHPLAYVGVKPHAGWTYKVTMGKLATPISSDDGDVTEAVSSVTWTADSATTAIKPGEFDEFEISTGPLPEADSMTFKALQTYSDGSIVRWIEPAAADGSEPEHPAPVLTLTAATADHHGAAASPAVTVASDSASSSDGSTNSVPGIILGSLGLAIGIIAAVAAFVALRRTRPGTAA